jgi:3-hydroxymyristoyl/3-hydroxydecanoyl-(acyl carrier protein) dehydratase
LRRGDLAGAFGSSFSGLALAHPPCLPSGKLALLDRVPEFDPNGGACGLGFIAAELDIHADDWHMVCHFVDDRVMPGTLMYEACAQTLRILMWRWGWLGEEGTWRAEPTPGVTSSLRCRGQVIPGCRVLRYEITVTGRSHETCPRALADAVLLVDGKPVVSIENMAISFVGLQAESIDRLWSGRVFGPASTYNYDRILAYCIGKPSEAFGEPYRIFDQGRIIARLPGPPYLFLDRIEAVDATPWKLLADARATGAYDVPQAPWYCAEAGQPGMPFAVLLEVALQVCGWLAAHGGAALLSPTDVSFRNLGGKAVRHQPVLPGSGALVTTVTQTKVSRSAGMIILEYDLDTRMNGGLVYTGQTSFGFFPKEALARQVGIAEARPWRPDPSEVLVFQPVPTGAGLPRDRWQMLDLFAHLPAGGPHGLGWLEGRTEVDPEAWFFEAHFYQDPVWPGSLGLEAFLQLLHYDCLKHWGPGTIDLVDGTEHRWTYRGQVTPGIRHVTVLAEIISRDPSTHELEGRGWLCVGDKIIYGMEGFRVRWTSGIAGTASAR